MAYNYRFQTSIREFFYDNLSIEGADSELKYENNNIFKAYLRVQYDPIYNSGEFEIPTMHYKEISTILSEKSFSPMEFVVPLYKRNTDSKTSFDGFLYAVSRWDLIEVYVKGRKYYGGHGIILDEDFNILVLCTRLCEFCSSSSSPVLSKRVIVRISPRVFRMNDRTLERGIINRLIPYLTSYYVRYESEYCKIIIDDLDEYTIRPTQARVSDLDFNKVLEEHIDEVVDQI